MTDNPFVQHAELHLFHGAYAAARRIARMGLSMFAYDRQLLDMAATCAVHLGDDADAAAYWARLREIEPSAATCNSLALCLERLGRPIEAEAAFRQALLYAPEDATPQTNLGLLLENLGRLEEAESAQRKALALAPARPEILSNLAGILLRRGQPGEAETRYRQAIALAPDFVPAHSNLAILLADDGRIAAAEASFRRALTRQPANQLVRMNLGELLLAQGRFAEGWPLYEGRHDVSADPVIRPEVDLLPCPQWQGQSLAGKSLIVLPEQGLGDEIQFCRYMPWLKEQGVAHLTLVCRPQLKALLQTLAGPDLVIELSELAAHLPGQDYWVFLLSLPMHAATTLATIPAQIPYLVPDTTRLERLAGHLAGEGLRVGLVWHGNRRHLNDAERSLPCLDVLAPLWNLSGIRYFSLQKNDGAVEEQPCLLPLVDLAPALADFADTAVCLSQLDLLLTVDTSVGHLAGALGIPCWLLLPYHKTDWRWLQKRSDSPWYGATRLFRQAKRGDWATTIEQVGAALVVVRDAAERFGGDSSE